MPLKDMKENKSYLEDEEGVREMARKALEKASTVWGRRLEEAAYKVSFADNGAGDGQGECSSLSEKRKAAKAEEDLKDYRRLVRLLSTNLRRAQSKHVLDRLDKGVLTCEQVMSFTPQDYQPEKHKVVISEEPSPFNLKCSTLACEQCGSKEVKYMNISSARDGYCKAETWGRKDCAEPTSKAQCQKCFFEWTFEPI